MFVIAVVVLLGFCLWYVFRPSGPLQARPAVQNELESLRERRQVIYDNLRDLNFEYRAGKYPAEDYAEQREALEQEAANVVLKLDRLEAAQR